MSELKLTKNGLEAKEWDEELREKHRVKKQGDGYCIIDKETKQIVHTAPTREEAEEFFWKEKEILSVWTYLRDTVDLEEGVTIADVISVIQDREELKVLCDLLFPKWEQFNHEGVEVFCHATIVDGEICFASECEPTNDGLLTCRSKIQVCTVEGVLCEGNYHLSFLEILDALFGEKKSGEIPIDLLSIPIGMISLGFLLSPISVEPGITIQDIFDFVGGNEDLKMFISMYSWCRAIDAFHEEARNCPPDDEIKNEDDEERFYFSNVKRVFDVYPSGCLEHYVNFGGIGKVSKSTLEHYEKHGGQPPAHEDYGVGFSRAYAYAHLPFKADEHFIIRRMPSYSRRGNIKEGMQDLAKVSCHYTLLEILDAIYWEISFYGGPQGRDVKLEEIVDCLDECKQGRGKTFKSVDEMLDALETDDD